MLGDIRYTILLLGIVCAVMTAFYVASTDISISLTPISIGVFSDQPQESKPPSDPEEQRILFGGDVMLARAVERTMNVFGSDYPYQKITSLFKKHDVVVVNFESSIPKQHVPTPDMTFAFSTNRTHLSALSASGVTHTSLANNHSFDYGYEGYLNTKKTLQENSLVPFGKPYNLATNTVVFIHGEQKLALIGIDLTQNQYTKKELEPIFTHAAIHSEKQIIVVHWGTEYKLTHSLVQEEYARLFIELGADLIIGHHPHVVQDIARIDSVLVFYSLGNLIFDQYFSAEVQEGMLLSYNVQKESVELVPITSIGSRNQPEPMPELEQDIFLEELQKRSDTALAEDILKGTLKL